jgi:hypothetical protein
LGDLMAWSYQGQAWDCYDIARAVNPNHIMLQAVDRMEKKLTMDFPDFF